LSLESNKCLDCSDYGVRYEGCPYNYELVILDSNKGIDLKATRIDKTTVYKVDDAGNPVLDSNGQ
jgi:hypothetical protein